MFYSLLLSLHLGGAAATAVVASYTGVVLWRSIEAWYRRCAIALGVLAALEVATGTALTILVSKLSIMSLCNLALYLMIVSSLLAALYLRIKGISTVSLAREQLRK